MIYVFAAGVLWGTIGIFVNTLTELGAASSQVAAMRMCFAFAIMSVIAALRLGKSALLRDPKTIFLCALLGLISNGVFNICYTASIKINGMGIACVLMYTAPVFTAIASRIFFHEKFSPLKIFALIVNIAGCILTVTGGEISAGSMNWTGLLAGLGSGFCYGMAAIFGKAAGKRTDPLTMSAYSYLFAALFLLCTLRPELPANPKILGTGFLYGLIPTSIAYVVYYIGLGKVRDTGKVPVIASIEPVTALIIGVALYGERIGAVNFTGIAVVLISIIIMVKSE